MVMVFFISWSLGRKTTTIKRLKQMLTPAMWHYSSSDGETDSSTDEGEGEGDDTEWWRWRQVWWWTRQTWWRLSWQRWLFIYTDCFNYFNPRHWEFQWCRVWSIRGWDCFYPEKWKVWCRCLWMTSFKFVPVDDETWEIFPQVWSHDWQSKKKMKSIQKTGEKGDWERTAKGKQSRWRHWTPIDYIECGRQWQDVCYPNSTFFDTVKGLRDEFFRCFPKVATKKMLKRGRWMVKDKNINDTPRKTIGIGKTQHAGLQLTDGSVVRLVPEGAGGGKRSKNIDTAKDKSSLIKAFYAQSFLPIQSVLVFFTFQPMVVRSSITVEKGNMGVEELPSRVQLVKGCWKKHSQHGCWKIDIVKTLNLQQPSSSSACNKSFNLWPGRLMPSLSVIWSRATLTMRWMFLDELQSLILNWMRVNTIFNCRNPTVIDKIATCVLL